MGSGSSLPPPAVLSARDKNQPVKLSAEPIQKADRTRRFPLRREGGGTRAACASRLIAHLVPESGEFDPGRGALIGLIEGNTPQPVAMVIRINERDWVVATRPSASLRLFRLPQAAGDGLWESFPACEGPAEPVAPPARSLLLQPGERPTDRPYQEAIQRLWRSCGNTLPTEVVLRDWDYGHLRDGLPAELAVTCESLPQTAASGN